MTEPDYSWVPRAACHGDDNPEQFFREPRGHSAIETTIGPIADQYCAHCPTIDDCLQLALHLRDDAHGGVHGLWGGIWWRGHKPPVNLLRRPAIDGGRSSTSVDRERG